MNRFHLIVTIILITTAHSLFSQSITNVQAKAEGNTVVISYQLQSSNAVEITLYVSEDGGRTFTGLLNNVRGDVGKGIQQGGKRIVWDVLNEKEFLHNSNLVFRVKAFSPFSIFLDPRDGKTYKTVQIGNQLWMAENLAYKPNSGNFWVYNNDPVNLTKYGYLYDSQAIRNVCPVGWHLPSDTEWEQLTDFIGSNSANKLKAQKGWDLDCNGSDDYGFSALPGGYIYALVEWRDIGVKGYWWSSTGSNFGIVYPKFISCNNNNLGKFMGNSRWGYSVRCLKD